MKRTLMAMTFLLSVVRPACAQRNTALDLHTQQATLEPGTSPWFAVGLELVEAELEFDVAAAIKTAQALIESARAADQPGVLAAAVAQRELASATLEGPKSAAGRELAAELPDTDVPPSLRAYYHAARARRMDLEDMPIDVLSHALAGLRAARESDDLAQRLRCAWIVHHITEFEVTSYDAELMQEIEQLMRQPLATRFAPWRLLNDYWRTHAKHTTGERQHMLDDAARGAEAIGDLRTLCQVDWDRAVVAAETGEIDRAFAYLESAHKTSERAGHRRALATSLEIAAGLALDHAQLERCDQYLRQATSVVEGRGLADKEVGLAHLGLRLAVARKEEAQIAALTERLVGLRHAEAERRRGYAALREQLLRPEHERIEFERSLQQAHARAAQTLNSVYRTVGAGIAVALGLLVVLSLRSRRRLLTTNQRLEEAMRRAEAEADARSGLEQRMRLLERSESLGLVASGIAHDFNNLLAGVLGNAHLLRETETNAERGQMLDAIANAGARGARLCTQLQTYSGDEPIALEPVDLGVLVRDLGPMLDMAAGANLVVEVGPIPKTILVDGNRTQLEQAILNLVTNARDARAPHVRLNTSRVTRAEADWNVEFFRGEPSAGEYACIEVSDDGEGMSAELLERIFDPFFTTRFPGRGLGLAVVLGAMRQHRGVVTVSSQPGAGTRFRLYLPLRRADAPDVVLTPQPARDTRRPVPPPQPMRVLVVDDEADVRAYVRAALQARGHRVVTTGNGAAAAAELRTLRDGEQVPGMAAENAPDGGRRRRNEDVIALVDLSMPVVDGRAVVHALRAERDAPAIVLMSGHAATHLAEAARDLAVDGSIAKPFTGAQLEEALTLALDAHASRLHAADLRAHSG